MATVENLLKQLDEIHSERRRAVKSVLADWLNLSIVNHQVWRAVVGHKRCKFIPIYKNFYYKSRFRVSYHEHFSKKECYDFIDLFSWPDLPDQEILECIQGLGFLTSGNLENLCLAIPPFEKGKPLTFAQEWVKKINNSYSQYIKKERETAKMVFAIFIDKVYSASKVKTNVKICEGYLLVENFNLPKPSISIKCHSFLKGLMKKHRIEEYFEKGEYIGIRIFHSQP